MALGAAHVVVVVDLSGERGTALRIVQGGMQGRIGDGGQRPGGTVAGECAFHGAAVAEEESIGGGEKQLIHGGYWPFGGRLAGAVGEGDGGGELHKVVGDG
ncbi:MAG: hypothetical protein BWX86_00854 [Verrucomicrobia bacterium ADurb.Bin122]|nr:MAG: hypothetical protein BWX86_00854 [Verrucomicrobia bacterium ADurb.Bin122]